MKILYLLPLLFTLGCSENSSTEKDEAARIKQVKQEVFLVDESGLAGDRLDEYDKLISGDFELDYLNLYDEAGNVTESTHYNSKGEVQSKTSYKYDASGNLTSEVISEDLYYKEMVPLIASLVTNKDGSVSEKKLIPKTNKDEVEYIYYHTYRYDDKGNILEDWSHEYEADGDFTEKYTYDENNRVVTYTSEGMFGTSSESYKYDENGDVVELNYSSEETDPYSEEESVEAAVTTHLYTFSYEYDEQGSWTKRTTSENGKPIKITVRTIEYY